MNINKNIYIVFISIIILLTMFSVGYTTPSADILYNKSELGDGWWKYEYTFSNASTDGECLYKTRLNFYDPEVFGYSLPAGWESIRWEGTYITDWMATRTTSDYCMTPGESQSGFIFDAKFDFGSIGYKTSFLDVSGNDIIITGQATRVFSDTTPVVPEPVSSVLFIAGGATLGFRRFSRKFKK